MLKQDTQVDAVRDEAASFQNSPTFIHAPQHYSPGLIPDEDRLVVFCCSLAGNAALELLDQVAPERAAMLREEATGMLGFARRDRLAVFSRKFAPPPAPQAIRRLAQRLNGEPIWFAAAVCQRVAPEVRDRLMTFPSIRDAWRNASAVHPALANHAFRFAARALND
ncbi:MAG TPA: hypothetical protein VGK67_31090 [Myxococcales bacterium]|jgi:hypothetical protein